MSAAPASYRVFDAQEASRTRSAPALNFAWPALTDFLTAPETLPIIRGWLPTDGFVVIYGAAKSGKTFTALDMALCIATGDEWHGRTVTQGHVVYLCGEGMAGMRKRMRAWLKRRGRDIDALGNRFHLLPLPIALDQPALLNELLADIRAQIPEGERLVLIVIDTLSRYASGNQDAADAMGAFVAGADRLRKPFADASVLVVHHAGKDQAKGMRGSTALVAAADFVLFADKPQASAPQFTLSVQWSKDWETPEPLGLVLDRVELDVDADGEPITSCVVVEDDSGVTQKARPRLTDNEKLALDELHNAILDLGEPNPRTSGLPSHVDRVVRHDHWREFAYRRSVTVTPDTKRQRFHRAVTGLQSKGEVGICEPYAWVIPHA